MKHSKRFLFLVVFFLETNLLFSQKIEFATDNVLINISLQNHGPELFQSWKIVNGNTYPIYIPAFKSDSIAPKFEIRIINNALNISVGQHSLKDTTLLPGKMPLLKLLSHDTLSFIVMLTGQKGMTFINKATYNQVRKEISFDYLTEENFKKATAKNDAVLEIVNSKYSELARYIRFKFLYSYY